MKYTRENATSEPKQAVPPNFSDRVKLQIKSAEFGQSSSNNDMVTLTCEIIEPEEHVSPIDGKTYKLDQQEVKYFLVLRSDLLDDVLDFNEKLGLPAEVDPDNVSQYESIKFAAILQSKQDSRMKRDPENPKKYIPITDDNGQPIKGPWQWRTNLRDVLGLCESDKEAGAF